MAVSTGRDWGQEGGAWVSGPGARALSLGRGCLGDVWKEEGEVGAIWVYTGAVVYRELPELHLWEESSVFLCVTQETDHKWSQSWLRSTNNVTAT